MLTRLLRLILSLLWLLLSHWFYNVSFSFLSRDQGSLIRSRLYGWALLRFFQKSIYGLTLVLFFANTLLILPLSDGFLLWEILRNLLEAKPDYDFWVESSSWKFLILWGDSLVVNSFNCTDFSIFYKHSFPMELKHVFWRVVLLEDLTTINALDLQVSALIFTLISL